jgi:hypothetical protein
MFFVSKKKYDALKEKCDVLETSYATVSSIAKDALNNNGRLIDHWDECLKENEKLKVEIAALKEETCQDDQQKLDLP